MCRARIASNEPAALGGRMPTGHVSVVHRLAPRTFASSSWHSAAKSTLFCTKFRCLHACPTTTRREHAVSSGCTAAPLSGVTCRKWLRPRNSRRLREPRDHKISNNKGAQDKRSFVVRFSLAKNSVIFAKFGGAVSHVARTKTSAVPVRDRWWLRNL